MHDCDRISLGWQIWLTPRQTRIISDRLCGLHVKPEDEDALFKLQEWFGTEVETQAQRVAE